MKRQACMLAATSLLFAACATPDFTLAPALSDDPEVRAAIERHRKLALREQEHGNQAAAAAHWQVLGLLAPEDPLVRARLAAIRSTIDRSAAELLENGVEAYRNKQFESARLSLLKLLALTPDNADAQALLREIERQKIVRLLAERSAPAASYAGSPPARTPKPSDKVADEIHSFDLEQTLELVNAGDIEGGLREMRRYVAANPRDSQGRQRLAEAVYRHALLADNQGRVEAALPLYEQAIAVHGKPRPEWTSRVQKLRRTLARDYYAKGLHASRSDLALAIRHWETSLRYDPDLADSALKLQEARRMQDKLRRIDAKPHS